MNIGFLPINANSEGVIVEKELAVPSLFILILPEPSTNTVNISVVDWHTVFSDSWIEGIKSALTLNASSNTIAIVEINNIFFM